MTIKELADFQLKAEDITLRAMFDLRLDLVEECAKIWDAFRFGKITLDNVVAQIDEIEKKLAC